MRKFITILFIFLFFGLTIVEEFDISFEDINLNPNDYARITDVEYKAVVSDETNSKGKVIVTERLTFDIHAASKDNLFWELWRDLSEDYIDGVKVDYKVNSVKQILENGSEIIYKESPKLYWNDSDYLSTSSKYGPGKWYHSKGPYNESQRRYECVFFYVDGLYREKVTFEIEYEMYNAALRYNDCSELYLCLYSEDSVKHLESFKAEILVPTKDMPRTGNYFAHTYGTNFNEFPCSESDIINPGYHTFSFDLDKRELKFRPYNEYIEFSLVSYGADKHKFTDHASKNYYYYDNVLDELKDEQTKYEETPIKYEKTKLIILFISCAGAYLIIKYPARKEKKLKESHTFYEPTMKMHYFKDIPSNLDPTFASALVFSKDKLPKNLDGYAALMLSLVRKGYIELEQIDRFKDFTSHNIRIVIKYNPSPIVETLFSEPALELEQPEQSNMQEHKELEPLTPTEEQYFNLIVRHSNGNEISMHDFQNKVYSDYQNTDTFVRSIENSTVNIGISQGYFQKADFEQPKRELQSLSKFCGILGLLTLTLVNIISYQTRLDLAFGAFFILGGALIISAIKFKKMSRKYILFTQYGEDEYVKWRGLYNFLNSETLMNERTAIELPIWEQYLVYSTAFGISDKVIAALKVRCPEMDMSPMLRNPYYRSHSFYYSSRSFRRTTYSASSIARSGSYGGGWRIRWWRSWRRRWWRWPLIRNSKKYQWGCR